MKNKQLKKTPTKILFIILSINIIFQVGNIESVNTLWALQIILFVVDIIITIILLKYGNKNIIER